MNFTRTMCICAAMMIAWTLACSSAFADDVKVWNYEVLGDATRVANPGPVKPITIEAARNGSFSGAVAVDSAKPIAGLRASVGPLSKGAVSIPAANVTVRYAVAWTQTRSPPVGLDVLLESPPALVGVEKNHALAGVWVTVNVPPDAAAGLYRGELTVEANGLSARRIPVELNVSDWRVPDTQDWRTWIEMIQSPDTLAIEYGVPLWSDKHFALIAKSFRLIHLTGSRVVYIPLLRDTNQGNSESMVRWIKQKDGTYKQDYSVMEKYLDVAQKNLGDIKLVVFYAWDSYLTRSFRGKSFETKPAGGPELERWEKLQQGLTVTMLDPATGKTSPGNLPHYTDPGSKALWQPVYDELHKRMKARGLEKAMALGMVTDMEPSKAEVKFLEDVSGGLSWVAHSHYARMRHGAPSPNKLLAGIADIRYEAHAYDVTYEVNPDITHLYGWKLPDLSAFLDRFGELNGEPLRIRQVPQLNITGKQRGVGRLGGDYWPAIRDKHGDRAGEVFARYPDNHWRGLDIASYFLAPGPNGPVATSRLQNLIEGVQECEARIQIESALLNPDQKKLLGPDLARHAQKVLDDIQRAMWQSIWSNPDALKLLGAISGRDTYEAIWGASAKVGIKLPDFWSGPARKMRSAEDRKGIDWFTTSDWRQRDRQLFAVAAEVRQRLK